MRWISAHVVALFTILALTFAAPAAFAEEPVWTKATVKKVDKELGKVTLRHEEITNLDMPSMTMKFRVKDPALLEQLKPGQEGEFYLVKENGRFTIKQIRE